MAENEQSIEELQRRYNELNERKITANANLKTARTQLDKLKQQAIEQYGTDDVDELRKKLQEMKDENERKRREYQESLDKIESELERVDQEYADAAKVDGKDDADE